VKMDMGGGGNEEGMGVRVELLSKNYLKTRDVATAGPHPCLRCLSNHNSLYFPEYSCVKDKSL